MITLLTSILSPDWLKYGFTGLVAIFLIIIFYQIKPLIADNPKKKFWPLIFIVTCFVLLTIGGISSYLSDRMKFNNKTQIDSAKIEMQAVQRKLDIYTGTSPENDSLKKRLELIKLKNEALVKQEDSLHKVENILRHKISSQKILITDLVVQTIADDFDSDMLITSGKSRLKIPDVNFKRMQRATFLNMKAFNADKDILQRALTAYANQSGDIAPKDIRRVVHLLPRLMRLRLSWIKNQAIPALEEDMRELSQHPEQQRNAAAAVALPAEAIIISASEEQGGNKITVTSLPELNKERLMLQSKLSQMN